MLTAEYRTEGYAI